MFWVYFFGGWLLLAAIVGLVVGRVIRNRDRQVPTANRETEKVQGMSTDQQEEGNLSGA